MFENLKADTRRLREIKSRGAPWYVLESLLFENGYQAVVLYRIAHWFRRRQIPVLGPLIARLSLLLTGVDLAPGAVIGPGLMISHGTGLVVGHWTRIGSHATLLHQVTLGSPSSRRIDEMPILGDRVFVGAGSRIIGRITIGDDVFIGVDAIVTDDVPPRSKVTTTASVRIERRDPEA